MEGDWDELPNLDFEAAVEGNYPEPVLAVKAEFLHEIDHANGEEEVVHEV